jgi:hypothetical protein
LPSRDLVGIGTYFLSLCRSYIDGEPFIHVEWSLNEWRPVRWFGAFAGKKPRFSLRIVTMCREPCLAKLFYRQHHGRLTTPFLRVVVLTSQTGFLGGSPAVSIAHVSPTAEH